MSKFIVANVKECIGCHVCEISCAVAHNNQSWPKSKADYHPRIWLSRGREDFHPQTCHHCQNAPCIASCPVNALYRDNNSVQLDEKKCIGCKSCIIACPFGVITLTEAAQRSYAQKCDLCVNTPEQLPSCVAHCPSQALHLMDDSGLEQLRKRRQRASITPGPTASRLTLRQRMENSPPRKEAFKILASERKENFNEIYQPIDKPLADYESARCLHCASYASCNLACPLHNAIPELIQLVKQNELHKAVELSHQTSSLPEICGLVCPQDRLCEGSCTLKSQSGAVAIGSLERYITQQALQQGWRPDLSQVVPRSERVAIIGAGPAGLGCADILTRQGFQVDVYDRHPEIGGLLTFGIPSFKLNKGRIAQRREIFSQMGIRFHLNCELGKDVTLNELLTSHDAIFLGVGSYGLVGAGLANENAAGVVQALPFLIANTRREMGLAEDAGWPWQPIEGKNVVVLGGGDSAMDCVRTAIRRHASSVTCAYRRDEASMPGSKKEVVNAREEGVNMLFNVQPEGIELDETGMVTGVRLVRTEMGLPGADGRRRPVTIPDSEFVLPADLLIMAFGFTAHAMPWLAASGIDCDNKGLIITEQSGTFSTRTSNQRVFAGGDAVHGADLVVTAMEAGRRAGKEIISFLGQG
ncbi:FAD-dependent oxidoreductase [Pantoea sp. B65]|uniref:FAD-dependent oxidoreductase n=1 Tax=Pantoea sp. B65 TaxID=2813359 RepID=UPI0039B5C163